MDSNRILFYERASGSNNGWETYDDELAITNYRNKSMTIQQFYTIAKQYVDTVKAAFPVSGVVFLGQKPGETLPPAGDDDYMDELRKLVI